MTELDSTALTMVFFRAAGHEIAVEARKVAAMRTAPEANATPIEDLLGLPEAEAGTDRRWLIMRSATGDLRAVTVGEPVRLDSMPVDQIFMLPALVQARQELRGIVAVALPPATSTGAAAESVVLIVDLDKALCRDTQRQDGPAIPGSEPYHSNQL